jgi:hypothetical protein
MRKKKPSLDKNNQNRTDILNLVKSLKLVTYKTLEFIRNQFKKLV